MLFERSSTSRKRDYITADDEAVIAAGRNQHQPLTGAAVALAATAVPGS